MYAIRSYYDWYSCKNNHINVVDSSFRHKLGIDISESTCIYAFNGNCSSCISDLIDYQKQWNAKFPCSNVIYLSNSSNKEIIEYYIDKFELSINNDNVLSRDRITSYNVCYTKLLRLIIASFALIPPSRIEDSISSLKFSTAC